MRPPFSMLNAKRFDVVYVLHHLYMMYSNVQRPPMTLRNYQPVAWVLYQRVIDQSKADIFIKPGISGILKPQHIPFGSSLKVVYSACTSSEYPFL
jgi:hypothetical protein